MLTHPLIDGLDGRKMSKTYGNSLGLTDSARDMTFAIMRLDDRVMQAWFTYLTRVPETEIAALLAGHPREAKARLAREITAAFHDEQAAGEAAQAFDREVRDKQLPDELPETAWDEAWGEELPLANLLKAMGLAASTSDARRAARQGGVRIDGAVERDPLRAVSRPAGAVVIQVGKKRFGRLLG